MLGSLPGPAKKGGAPNAALSLLVKRIWIVTEETIKIKERGKLCWGAIAALIMVAFPEWFKRSKNAVRNVKRAHRLDSSTYFITSLGLFAGFDVSEAQARGLLGLGGRKSDLQSDPWPGNMTELDKIIERTVESLAGERRERRSKAF